MYSEKDISHGLEWICHKTKIVISHHNDSVDVLLYPEYPDESKCITLYLDVFQWQKRVRVTDLVGNGYQSDLQGKGYGTLIFNVGIQAVCCVMGIEMTSDNAKEINVSGKVSSMGDPDDEPERSVCRDRRNRFWADRGFILADQSAFDTSMKATLAELKPRGQGIADNGAPKNLNIDCFWKKGEAPASRFNHALEAVLALKRSEFSMDLCPSKDEVEQALNLTIKYSGIIRKTAWMFISCTLVYLAFQWLPPFSAITSSIGIVFFAYLGTMIAENRLWQHLPGYRRYIKLREQRADVLTRLREVIEKTEKEYNGLAWRVHAAISEYGVDLPKRFDMVAERSKNQNIYRLSEEYLEYLSFISTSKDIILRNNILGRI